jgi:hypothetical protein
MVLCARPASMKRGVRPIVTRRGARDAMDGSRCKTSDADPYGKSVWSWHPWAGANPRVEEPGGTVTKRSWTPGRARHKRSNHRAGNVSVSASSAVTTLVCFLPLHTRLRVQQNTRHSLRPLIISRVVDVNLGPDHAARTRRHALCQINQATGARLGVPFTAQAQYRCGKCSKGRGLCRDRSIFVRSKPFARSC